MSNGLKTFRWTLNLFIFLLLGVLPASVLSQDFRDTNSFDTIDNSVEQALIFDSRLNRADPMAITNFELSAVTPLIVSNESLDIYGVSLAATAYGKVSLQTRILRIDPETGSGFNQLFGSASYSYKSLPALKGKLSIADTEGLHLTTRLSIEWNLSTFNINGNELVFTPVFQFRDRNFDNSETIRDWGGSLEMTFQFVSNVNLSYQYSFADEISDDSSTLSIIAPWDLFSSTITSVFSIDDSDQVTFVLSIPL